MKAWRDVRHCPRVFESETIIETSGVEEVLRSENPSDKCAKLRTVAASNNRDHPTRSLYYCLFAPHTYIFVLRAHPVRGESHNQRNTTGEVATAVRQLKDCAAQKGNYGKREFNLICFSKTEKAGSLKYYIRGNDSTNKRNCMSLPSTICHVNSEVLEGFFWKAYHIK